MVLNTEDLDQIGADVTLPGVYIRDLDPSTTPSERNTDLLLERSPIQLVKQMDVATDKGWFSSFPPEALEEESFIYQVFQAAYQDKGQLDAAEYGRWTRKPFVLKGDGRSALAYTIPLIFEDGTVYGVLGVEMLTSYMQSLIRIRNSRIRASALIIWLPLGRSFPEKALNFRKRPVPHQRELYRIFLLRV